MKQQLHSLTIGVKDLGRMKDFYRGIFGWSPLHENEDVAIYQLKGILLTLFPLNGLFRYMRKVEAEPGVQKFYAAINFHSVAEVDQAFAELTAKGADALKKPQKVIWGGYAGFITDPEGNAWELVYNPFMVLDKNGNLQSYA